MRRKFRISTQPGIEPCPLSGCPDRDHHARNRIGSRRADGRQRESARRGEARAARLKRTRRKNGNRGQLHADLALLLFVCADCGRLKLHQRRALIPAGANKAPRSGRQPLRGRALCALDCRSRGTGLAIRSKELTGRAGLTRHGPPLSIKRDNALDATARTKRGGYIAKHRNSIALQLRGLGRQD